MTRRMTPVAATALIMLIFGCGQAGSPAVGTWSGQADMKDKNTLTGIANALAGNPLSGPATLTLKPDGTGFFKAAKLPEEPISWKEEGAKVIISQRTDVANAGDQPSANSNPPAPTTSGNASKTTFVGTMTPDHKSMTVDLGPAQVQLTKQTSSTQ